MEPPQTILLTGGSGNIGQALVPLLLGQHSAPKLVLPTSSIERFMINSPAVYRSEDPNLVLREGSIRDPIWFEELLVKHEVEAVFLCINGVDELFTAVQCLDAMSKAETVKKVVFLSIVGDLTSQSGTIDIYRHRNYPHILSKVVVEQKLVHAGYSFDWTVLGASVFFSNDLRLKVPLTQMGVYPEPSLAKGWSRTAVEDIAIAARNLFLDTTGRWSRKKIMLGSRHRYRTSEAAELWSKALRKPIQTLPASKDVLDQFEQNVRNTTGPGIDGLAWARDMRLLYEYHTSHGYYISDEEFEVQVQLLGKEPDDYGAWVEKNAASWI